jgi:hypothetical protein
LPAGRHLLEARSGSRVVLSEMLEVPNGGVVVRDLPGTSGAGEAAPRGSIWPYVLGGTGLTLLAAGISVYVVNSGSFDSWKARKRAWLKQANEPTTSWQRAGIALDEELQQSQRIDDISFGMGIAGTLLLGTAVGLLFFEPNQGSGLRARIGLGQVQLQGTL